jgi:hypothetical protein
MAKFIHTVPVRGQLWRNRIDLWRYCLLSTRTRRAAAGEQSRRETKHAVHNWGWDDRGAQIV